MLDQPFVIGEHPDATEVLCLCSAPHTREHHTATMNTHPHGAAHIKHRAGGARVTSTDFPLLNLLEQAQMAWLMGATVVLGIEPMSFSNLAMPGPASASSYSPPKRHPQTNHHQEKQTHKHARSTTPTHRHTGLHRPTQTHSQMKARVRPLPRRRPHLESFDRCHTGVVQIRQDVYVGKVVCVFGLPLPPTTKQSTAGSAITSRQQ